MAGTLGSRARAAMILCFIPALEAQGTKPQSVFVSGTATRSERPYSGAPLAGHRVPTANFPTIVEAAVRFDAWTIVLGMQKLHCHRLSTGNRLFSTAWCRGGLCSTAWCRQRHSAVCNGLRRSNKVCVEPKFLRNGKCPPEVQALEFSPRTSSYRTKEPHDREPRPLWSRTQKKRTL